MSSALLEVLRQQEILDEIRRCTGPSGSRGAGFHTTGRGVSSAVATALVPPRVIAFGAAPIHDVLRQPELLDIIKGFVGPSQSGITGLHAVERGVRHSISRGLQPLPQRGNALSVRLWTPADERELHRLAALTASPDYVSTTP